MLSEKTNELYRRTGCPFFDHDKKCWRVRFPDRDDEEGDLLYVASEFARTGLYYPYNNKKTRDKDYSGHAHTFFMGLLRLCLMIRIGLALLGLNPVTQNRKSDFLRQ